jgi:hypothetical protein
MSSPTVDTLVRNISCLIWAILRVLLSIFIGVVVICSWFGDIGMLVIFSSIVSLALIGLVVVLIYFVGKLLMDR